MTQNETTVIRLVPPADADGFWPRENYFEGEAGNGYALRLRPARALRLEPGARIRLVIPNHVPHLPYSYEGPATTLAPGREADVLFTWGGKVRLLDRASIEKSVRHFFDPSPTTETRDDEGNVTVQQGARGAPLLYAGEIADPA